jgi:hypothetical protein
MSWSLCKFSLFTWPAVQQSWHVLSQTVEQLGSSHVLSQTVQQLGACCERTWQMMNGMNSLHNHVHTYCLQLQCLDLLGSKDTAVVP